MKKQYVITEHEYDKMREMWLDMDTVMNSMYSRLEISDLDKQLMKDSAKRVSANLNELARILDF